MEDNVKRTESADNSAVGVAEKKENKIKDIAYKGPLSYVHLRIIAWIGMFILELFTIILYSNADKFISQIEDGNMGFVSLIGNLGFLGANATSCFVIASFAVILQEKEKYKSLLQIYALLAAGIAGLYYLAYFFDGVGLISLLGPVVQESINELWNYTEGMGFNLFIDVFLYTLSWFFVNYTPNKFFQGKKLLIFRLFSILPIVYVLLFTVLKALKYAGIIQISRLLYPIMPTNTVFQTIIFVFLLIYIKYRERRFILNGGTVEVYNKTLETNSNSLRFSVICSSGFFIAGIIGLVLSLTERFVAESCILFVTDLYLVLGVYSYSAYLMMVPLILLFSYTRRPRKESVDVLVTVGGLFVLAILYLIEFLIK